MQRYENPKEKMEDFPKKAENYCHPDYTRERDVLGYLLALVNLYVHFTINHTLGAKCILFRKRYTGEKVISGKSTFGSMAFGELHSGKLTGIFIRDSRHVHLLFVL